MALVMYFVLLLAFTGHSSKPLDFFFFFRLHGSACGLMGL